MPAASPTVRRPEARRAVAHFVQAALRELAADVSHGDEVPFALDSRTHVGGPALYEYRPLYRTYVEARLERIVSLADYKLAVSSLADDPAVLGVARDYAPDAESDEDALRAAVLVPLLVGVAEGAGGFDFDDSVFDGIFDRMLSDVAQTRRSFTGFAPVIGLRAIDGSHDLGQDIRARRISPVELAESWPECQGLLPERFGVARDRLLGLELDVAMPRAEGGEMPDTARRFARAILALRLVFGGPITVGPVLFERVDWAPRAVRALPASVTQELPGDPVRLDPQKLFMVRALADRMADAEVHGGPVAVALGRWATASGAAVAAERAAGLAAAVEPLLGADGAGPPRGRDACRGAGRRQRRRPRGRRDRDAGGAAAGAPRRAADRHGAARDHGRRHRALGARRRARPRRRRLQAGRHARRRAARHAAPSAVGHEPGALGLDVASVRG